MDLSQLSDEQLQTLISQMTDEGEGEGKDKETAGEVSYQLPDGSTIRGTPEQVNQALLQRLKSQEQFNTQEAPQNMSQQGYRTDAEQYDFNKFQETLVNRKDALDAIRYAFRTQAGFDPVEGMQALGLVVSQLAQTVNELNTTTALSRLEGFDNSPENVKKLESIIEDRGWPRSQKSYEDAYILAKSRGELQDSQQKTQPFSTQQGFPQATQQRQPVNPYMPNLGSNASEIVDPQADGGLSFEMEQKVNSMSDDQLVGLIQQLEAGRPQ